jgi:hypothetical protein
MTSSGQRRASGSDGDAASGVLQCECDYLCSKTVIAKHYSDAPGLSGCGPALHRPYCKGSAGYCPSWGDSLVLSLEDMLLSWRREQWLRQRVAILLGSGGADVAGPATICQCPRDAGIDTCCAVHRILQAINKLSAANADRSDLRVPHCSSALESCPPSTGWHGEPSNPSAGCLKPGEGQPPKQGIWHLIPPNIHFRPPSSQSAEYFNNDAGKDMTHCSQRLAVGLWLLLCKPFPVCTAPAMHVLESVLINC